MSSCSTPKRILGLEDDGTQSEVEDFQAKRVRVDGSFATGSSSGSGIGTPCDSLSIRIQHDVMDTEEERFDGGLALPHRQDPRFLAPPVFYPNLSPHNTFHLPAPECRDLKDQSSQDTHEEPPPTRLCFGMLRDIQVRIDHIKDPQSLHFTDIPGEHEFASLDLSIQDDRCDILSLGTSIATMNRKTHHALNSIRLPDPPIWTGVMPKSELQQRLIAAGTSPRSKVTCKMSVLVIGAPSIAQTLARELAKYHLFLQHPDPKPANLGYDNPQYLSLVGAPCLDRPILPPILDIPNQRDGHNSEGLDGGESEDVRVVLDTFPQQTLRNEVEIDSRIRTRLESHQREAVDFILSRESAHSEHKNKLWRLERRNFNEDVYKHIITGARSREPVDFCGGVLGDDMGVGKTLSMIASIVAGLPRDETSLVGDKWIQEPVNADLIPVRATLVVVPSFLLIRGWVEEIEKHVIPGALKYYKYHGPGRCISLSSPPSNYIIFSTYATVEADFSSSGGDCVLNRIHWHRLILDEAHVIRNSSTKQFKAIESLSASIRWCMTGTPIQNSLNDLLSLVRFLHVPHLDSVASFRKHMLKGLKSTPKLQPDYVNLKLLLASICLRRTMSTVFPSLGGIFVFHRPSFSDAERRVYDELLRACARQLKASASLPTRGRESQLMLTANLRLRMFCNAGLSSSFLGGRDDSDGRLSPDAVVTLLQQSGQNICSVCNMEVLSLDFDDRCNLPVDWLSFGRALKCETCAQLKAGVKDGESPCNLAISTTRKSDDDAMEDVQFSSERGPAPTDYPSKLVSLLADIREHYAEDKSIIFSFWRESLDIVGRVFDEQGMSFCRVDGKIAPTQRQAVLEEFQRNSAVRVLLMTIGTGAVGLNNLSVASRIHILEPQWNPSVESQAIGRALRWGQGKKVFVIRYIMKGTVEENIESGQEWKKQLSLIGREVC
ncbi:hypothetical protein P170DRAFT_463556 [Aspergillus steynii IBT 23096]|uniref:SNF2 family helicase n=1 Tax=Aspergillus steynii IBT 23096 TaxID=1392250 RepID=A0A2I2GBR1_9EURO|nr:uncharacterized protein P170DRAFT_463556 [Aspergillus steynii IBT 23096]PLB50322.1 hypothetical protein P170DRAFT_463556 [Aspergillus steynii IBT 23096]